MSQNQPRRCEEAEKQQQQQPIKYGDVFNVSGELASNVITPRDAALMQATENKALGQTQRGGPASVMQSAASLNKKANLLPSNDDVSDVVRNKGMSVSETKVGATRVITEAVGPDVVAQYVEPEVPMRDPGLALQPDAITVGEALEASALSEASDKAVEESDAAAIQAAEMRATGRNEIIPGGVAARAQAATSRNARTMSSDHRTTLSDVLTDAKQKLPADKKVTREDAEGVIGAEIRNTPDMKTTPGGVAASLSAAAAINQNK